MSYFPTFLILKLYNFFKNYCGVNEYSAFMRQLTFSIIISIPYRDIMTIYKEPPQGIHIVKENDAHLYEITDISNTHFQSSFLYFTES